MRDQPQIHHQHLSGDVRESGVDAVADRAEPARRQMPGKGQHDQAEHCAGQAEKKSRRQKIAEQQAARHHAQQRYPRRRAPAVTRQHDQRDDVGQPRFDAGQRRGDGAFQYRQAERHRRHARDVVVFGGGVQLMIEVP